MKKSRIFRIKNALLFSNLISNVIGVSVVMFLNDRIGFRFADDLQHVGYAVDAAFLPFSFLIPLVLTLLYERPIRQYAGTVARGGKISEGFAEAVQRRLLNEPFFLIAVDMSMWLIAAALYSTVYRAFGAEAATFLRPVFMSLFTGLITVTVAFFVFEHVLRKVLAPFYFPHGALYETKKTIRIRIRTRLVAFLCACNIVPLLAILNLLRETLYSPMTPASVLQHLRTELFFNALIFMGVGAWLTFLVSGNLTGPLQEIVRVLRRVKDGDFNRKVQVTSNDEIGYTGDAINEMTDGLRERDFIKETFGKYVAAEVRDEVLSGRVSLDGEVKEVTILFADLRDFTPMTESHPPQLVVRIINRYFEAMGEAIQQEKGLVLQFLGDEIYAVFGAPVYRPDHPVRALKAAVSMNRRLVDLNAKFEQQGWPPLRHGIGIHSGEVVAANIGSPDRLSYLLVGDTVNLASRLQGLSKKVGEDIVVSESTKNRAADRFRFRSIAEAGIRGKQAPVHIYTLA